MKKMNNKGFLLAESLVVSTFVLTVLIFLFVQFKSLFNSYEDSYDYNTVEGIYNLNTMKKYIINNKKEALQGKLNSKGYLVVVEGDSCNKVLFDDLEYCDTLASEMGLKTLIYTKSFGTITLNNENFATQTFKNFISRIETKDNKERLIGQFNDGTYATIVYGEWIKQEEGE